MRTQVLPNAPNFYNYRGAALRALDYSALRDLESILRGPIPHLYDECEVGHWSELDDTYFLDEKIWSEEAKRPWLSVETKYLWTSQLGPGMFGFITRDGKVTGLSLDELRLQEVPVPVFRLKNLTRLIIRGNNLKEIPTAVGELTGLTALFIGEKNVSSLPYNLKSLQCLQYLQINDSPIEHLPPVLLNLPALRHVVINTRVPEDDPVVIALQEKALLEVRIGHYYDANPHEVKKLVMDFIRRHPDWDARHMYHFLDISSSQVESVLEELRQEGLLKA